MSSEIRAVQRRMRDAALAAVRAEARRALRGAQRDAKELEGPMRTEGDVDAARSDRKAQAIASFDAVYNSSGERTYDIREKLLEGRVLQAAGTLESQIAKRVKKAMEAR